MINKKMNTQWQKVYLFKQKSCFESHIVEMV